jgi:hypothetical protein
MEQSKSWKAAAVRERCDAKRGSVLPPKRSAWIKTATDWVMEISRV